MTDKERIYGQRIHKLLQDLHKDRTVLTLHLIGREYERLTIITGILNYKSTAYLTVDYPAGFRERVGDGKPSRLLFQFMGRDKIHYSFRADLKAVLKNDICVNFPDYIEKIQRRKFFRLVPPLGTKIAIAGLSQQEVHVLNISEGGALLSETRAAVEKPCMGADQTICDLRLTSLDNGRRFGIMIRKSLVRRVFKDQDTGKFHYAIQFLHMDTQDRHALGEWIFKCQREVLRKRNLLEGSS